MNLSRVMVLALLLAAPCLRSQDFAALERIFFDDALKSHDLDAHGATLLEVVRKDPASAEAWVALTRIMSMRHELASQRPLYDLLRGLAADDFRKCGVQADAFAESYCNLARDFETDPAWHATARRWGGVTNATWIGPFAESGPSAHDDAFAPEVLADFSRGAIGAYGPVQWRPLRPTDDPEGVIDLGREVRWLGCGYYFAFSLVAAAEREIVIKPEFNGPGRVWLNGELLADLDTRARDYPAAWLTGNLARGRNLLLVKLSSLSPLTVRLRTPQGGIAQGLVCEAPTSATPGMGVKPGAARQASFGPPEVADIGGAVPATPRQTAALLLAMATAYQAHSLAEAASELVERALAAAPEEPLVRLTYLRMLEDSPLYSSGERRRLQTATLDGLLAAHPGLVAPRLMKAVNLGRDERWQEADQELQQALAAAPGNWRVNLAQSELFQRAGWRPQALTALRGAYKTAPAAVPVLQALSRHWNTRGLPFVQMEFDRAILAQVPAQRDAVATLVSTLLRAAQPEEALKLARMQAALDPAGDYVQSRLATTLLACGKLGEACGVLEMLAARSGRPEEYLQQAAKACLQQGDIDRARTYLARAVEASPAEHVARRQLQRLTGERENFWDGLALPLEEALKFNVSPQDFPRADSIVLLDELVQVVFADGSSASYVHQVRKILTQEGVDARGKENVNGELVMARTIKADGTVLEPITFSGNQIEFPGVEIGCLIDIAWLNHADANPWCTLMGDRFFFADQKNSEPFAISRYVLVTPAAMPLGVRERNLRPGDFALVTAGQRAVRTWDVRRPQHPQAEDFAPSPLETIPWLEITQPRDWRRKARETAERGLAPGRRLTDALRAKAAELTSGAATDEQKARRLYEWVNEKLTTRGESSNAHQSLKALAGDRNELFAALCMAAGVPLGFAAADYTPEYKPGIEDDLPGLSAEYARDEDFTLFLLVVRGDNGGLVYLDLGDRLRPFGNLSARRSGAPAILWQQGRAGLVKLPAVDPASDRFENKATIRLAADGSATVDGSITIFGDRAWSLKEDLRGQAADDMQNQLEGELAGIFPGLELEHCAAPDIARAGTPLARTFQGKVAGIARAQGTGLAMALPLESLGQLLSALVGATERNTPLVLNFDLHQVDEIRIVAPKGWRFRALPEALVYPTTPLIYDLQFELTDGEVLIRRSLALGPGRIQVAGYAQLTGQVKRITQAEEAVLELEKTP